MPEFNVRQNHHFHTFRSIADYDCLTARQETTLIIIFRFDHIKGEDQSVTG